jgi:lipopolysaccharide/colanic/teichoic acid biosynthesis glycosyltransferase
LNTSHPTCYTSIGKRIIDLFGAIMLLLLFSPLLLLIALLLYFVNGGQILFTQQRPGKNGHLFWIYKFKTMHDKQDAANQLLPDFQRLHGLGKIIRKYSIDELPQLLNVLKGEMSLIGPRPLLPEYLPLYNSQQAKRHLQKPGITGLAQVKGRNHLTWKHSLFFDQWYTKNLSFGLDCKIALLTIKMVLKAKAINASKDLTRPPFKGE